MAKSKLKQITTYITPTTEKKMKKRRGQKGLISDSDYVRNLILEDTKHLPT